MLASWDWRGAAVFVAALGSATAAVLSALVLYRNRKNGNSWNGKKKGG